MTWKVPYTINSEEGLNLYDRTDEDIVRNKTKSFGIQQELKKYNTKRQVDF